MFLLLFAILLESVFPTWGQGKFQPYGPRMCTLRCQRTPGCSDHLIDIVQLTCELTLSATTLKNPSSEMDMDLPVVTGPQSISERITTPFTQSDKMATSPQSKGDATPCPEDTDFITECQDGNLAEVKRFVINGLVDINCQDDFGQTCVMSAAWKNRIDMFDFLEQRGCDMSLVDVDNSTALHFATLGDSIYIIKKLVHGHGCDIHWRDKTGKSPLLYATHIPIIKFLIDRGADARAIDKKNNTILHIVCDGGFTDAMKYIIALNIIDVETKGENGSTPLMMAVLSGHSLLVDILYTQHNASLKLSNDFGFNVFHIACIAGDLDMIKYLVSLTELRGYERKKDKKGNSPIQLAGNEDHGDIVTYLQTLKH